MSWRGATQDAPAALGGVAVACAGVCRVAAPLSTGARVRARTGGSLESVGRRLSLFGRLLDEASIAQLPREQATPADEESS